MYILYYSFLLILYIILDMALYSAGCSFETKPYLLYPNCTNPLCKRCLEEDPRICLTCRENTTIIDCEDRCVVSCQKRTEQCPPKMYAPWKSKEFSCCQRCFEGCDSGCNGSSEYVGPRGCFNCIHSVVEYDPISREKRYRCLKPYDEKVCEYNHLYNYFLAASSDTEKSKNECKQCDPLCSQCTSLGVEKVKHGCICNTTIAIIEEKDGKHYCKPKNFIYESSQIKKKLNKYVENYKTSKIPQTITKQSNIRMRNGYGIMEEDTTQKNDFTSTVVNQPEEQNSTRIVVKEDSSKSTIFILVLILLIFLLMPFVYFKVYLKLFSKSENIKQHEYDKGHGYDKHEIEERLLIGNKGGTSDPYPGSSTGTTLLTDSLKSSPSTTPTKQIRIINNVKKGKLLGNGAFGKVFQGKYFDGNKEIDVAIKVFIIHSKDKLSDEEQKLRIRETQANALKETSIMWKLQHPHIHGILGIILEKGVEIVSELRISSLQNYLSKHEKIIYYFNLIKYCKQIASAMNYLHEQRIIHGDLSARNVLVKDIDHVEVSDFGFANMLKGNKPINSELIPSRWCAPECILSHNFTKENDVWAYGVLCWEIFNYGNKVPYKEIKSDNALLRFLEENNVLQKPIACSHDFYIQIMLGCWIKEPESRLNFNQIVNKLDDFSS